jgi:hypothetical protein
MSKNITFTKEDIICMTLNMSNPHIEFLCERYNLDYDVIIDYKKRNIKYVYIDIKNFLIVAHLINNTLSVHVPYTTRINSVTLESIKPLQTPKLPKSKTPRPNNNKENNKVKDSILESNQNKTKELELIDVDNLLIEKEILESKISKVLIDLEEDMIKCVENEDYEKAAILRDKINKLK